MTKLKRYNDTRWALVTFNDKLLGKEDKVKIPYENKKHSSKEEIERASLSRTKANIKEICLCNDFEYFMTVTVSSENADRFSLHQVQDKMKKACHAFKRVYKDFKFIFITEKHEKGAFHFHGMVKGIPGDRFIIYREDEKLPIKLLNLIKSGEKIYHIEFFDENFGWNTFSKIKSYNKCCSYIAKYITKNCVKNENNQIYFF